MSEDDDSIEVDYEHHDKLIADVQSIGNEGKFKYKHQRGESALEVSEFGLPSSHGRLSLAELAGDSQKLGLKKALKQIAKHSSVAKETSVLKPQEEETTRIVSYEKVRNDLHKWDPIVWENRAAPILHFPLEKPSVRQQSLAQFAKEFTPSTSLENEVISLLHENSDSLSQFKNSRAEQLQMKKRALDEIRQRRSELIKQRMKVAYEAQKSKHRNKIKSRRYHKVLRRQKEAIKKKAEEALTGAEAAEMIAEKVATLEKQRIEERGLLRHRSGTKFSEKQKIMARFDASARQAVDNMTALSRSLTERITPNNDGDQEQIASESEVESYSESPLKKNVAVEANPWLPGDNSILKAKGDSKMADDTVKNGTAYVKLSQLSTEGRDSIEFFEGSLLPDPDISTIEEHVRPENQPDTIDMAIGGSTKPILTPGLVAETPHSDSQRLDVTAAFAEDDVVAEFISEKEKLAKKEQPEDIELSLPGWGDWTGPGISRSTEERQKKKRMLKAPRIERKDEKTPHVIIKEAPEKANEALAAHQPKNVPFPFTSVRDYERSMRQPLGREWVPEICRRDLIKPRVLTQLGAVIEPLDPDSKIMQKKIEKVVEIQAAQKKRFSKRKSMIKEHGNPRKKTRTGTTKK